MFTDSILKHLAYVYPEPHFTDRSYYLFEDLVESIISQQLSIKAADTIFRRFKQLFSPSSFPLLRGEGQPRSNRGQGEVSSRQAQTKNSFPLPMDVLQMEDQKIRNCGISFQKISYIKSVADAFVTDLIDIEKIKEMSDKEVIASLTQIRGIGRWTAEMTLIFTLQRPDVFSLGDLGIRNAIKKLYGITDKKEILTLSDTWKPYRSYACWYLWRSLENK